MGRRQPAGGGEQGRSLGKHREVGEVTGKRGNEFSPILFLFRELSPFSCSVPPPTLWCLTSRKCVNTSSRLTSLRTFLPRGPGAPGPHCLLSAVRRSCPCTSLRDAPRLRALHLTLPPAEDAHRCVSGDPAPRRWSSRSPSRLAKVPRPCPLPALSALREHDGPGDSSDSVPLKHTSYDNSRNS